VLRWHELKDGTIWDVCVIHSDVCICMYMYVCIYIYIYIYISVKLYMFYLLSSPYLLMFGDDRIRGIREQMVLM